MNTLLGLIEFADTQYFGLSNQEAHRTEVPWVDQETKLIRRQLRIEICTNATESLARWLRQRRGEIINESDENARGVETILGWLEQDYGRYNAIVTAVAAVDESVFSDARLEAIGCTLEELLFTAKAILYPGQSPDLGERNGYSFVKKAEEHSVLASNYNLRGVTCCEFRKRFKQVAECVDQTIEILEGLWSEKSDD